jgi:hypothetical protein
MTSQKKQTMYGRNRDRQKEKRGCGWVKGYRDKAKEGAEIKDPV